jgi:hypothetical protein
MKIGMISIGSINIMIVYILYIHNRQKCYLSFSVSEIKVVIFSPYKNSLTSTFYL